MFISELSVDTKFSLALFTMLIYLTVNYINKKDCFTNSDRDRLTTFSDYLTIHLLVLLSIIKLWQVNFNLWWKREEKNLNIEMKMGRERGREKGTATTPVRVLAYVRFFHLNRKLSFFFRDISIEHSFVNVTFKVHCHIQFAHEFTALQCSFEELIIIW